MDDGDRYQDVHSNQDLTNIKMDAKVKLQLRRIPKAMRTGWKLPKWTKTAAGKSTDAR